MAPQYTFEAFDPLTGDPPETNSEHFWGIVTRARAILKDRSRAEIIAIADLVAWLEQYTLFDRLQTLAAAQLGNSAEGTADNGTNEGEAHYSGSVGELRRFFETVPFQLISQAVSDVQWAEIFAVFALCLVSEAAEWEQEFIAQDVSPRDAIYSIKISPYAVEAMESVSIAEQLAAREQLPDAEIATVSEFARQVANARHQERNALKAEFVEFFLAGKFDIRAEAARQFYKGLSPEKKKLLRPSYAVNTLLRALRAHLREQ